MLLTRVFLYISGAGSATVSMGLGSTSLSHSAFHVAPDVGSAPPVLHRDCRMCAAHRTRFPLFSGELFPSLRFPCSLFTLFITYLAFHALEDKSSSLLPQPVTSAALLLVLVLPFSLTNIFPSCKLWGPPLLFTWNSWSIWDCRTVNS